MPHKPPLTGAFDTPLLPASTKAEGLDAAGLDIIERTAGAIDQFVLQQRRNVEAGIVDVHKARTSFDGVDVVYQNQFGRETITYTPHPTPPTPQPQPGLRDLIAVEFGDGES